MGGGRGRARGINTRGCIIPKYIYTHSILHPVFGIYIHMDIPLYDLYTVHVYTLPLIFTCTYNFQRSAYVYTHMIILSTYRKMTIMAISDTSANIRILEIGLSRNLCIYWIC